MTLPCRSNRDIADILAIGERTVETHVGNILNKLGFNSRVQIAAWAVDEVDDTGEVGKKRLVLIAVFTNKY